MPIDTNSQKSLDAKQNGLFKSTIQENCLRHKPNFLHTCIQNQNNNNFFQMTLKRNKNSRLMFSFLTWKMKNMQFQIENHTEISDIYSIRL